MTDEATKGASGRGGPELVAASVTIVVAVLAHLRSSGPNQLLPTQSEVGLVAAVTVVVAAILGALMRRLSAALQFGVTLAVTITLVLAVSFGLLVHDTSPGRSARHTALSGTRIPFPNENLRGRVSAGTSKYGTGYAIAGADSIRIHLDSKQSNLITWYPTRDPGQTYYAEVMVRRTQGSSIGTACALVFGYERVSSFYQLALRFDGLQLAHWDGSIPARAFEGPIPLTFARDLAQWHRLAVRVQWQQVTAFVDDRRVFTRELSTGYRGGVTFGTLDIGTGYTDDAECQFKDETVRSER